MFANIAYCGLNCAECEAYQATMANDQEWLGKIAAKWAVEYNSPGMSISDVTCTGCKAAVNPSTGNCTQCELRACGLQKGVTTCAHCSEYDTCAHLAKLFSFAPNLKITLDEIRAAL